MYGLHRMLFCPITYIFGVGKELKQHSFSPGSVITDKNSLKVAVKEGFISIHEIQLPGKRKMDIKSLLNGFQFYEDAKML